MLNINQPKLKIITYLLIFSLAQWMFLFCGLDVEEKFGSFELLSSLEASKMDDDEDAIYEQLLYAMFILLLLLLDIRLFWLICLEFKWWLKCASMPVFVFKLTLLLLTIILLPLLLFPFPFLPLELAEDFKLLIKYSSKSLCSFASSKFIFKLSMSSSSSLSKLLNELLHIWLRFFLLLFSFWIRL